MGIQTKTAGVFLRLARYMYLLLVVLFTSIAIGQSNYFGQFGLWVLVLQHPIGNRSMLNILREISFPKLWNLPRIWVVTQLHILGKSFK